MSLTYAGIMRTTRQETEPAGSAVGGVRASWWNAVASVVVAVLAAHVPVVVFLASPAAPGDGDAAVVARMVVVAIAVCVSLGAQLAMIPWLRPGLGGGLRSLPVAMMAVVAGAAIWLGLPTSGIGVLPLVSATSMIACASGQPLRRLTFLAAVGAAVASWLLAEGDYVTPAMAVLTIAYPYIVFGSVWAWDVITRLDAARAAEADLAVARERLRFASDLHDIQGHSLQVVALKAELAERLLEVRPGAAAAQLAEVRAEAAEALARTRELARGYRSTGIEDELDNARDVLGAAGFECSTRVAAMPRDGDIRSLFGRALREATTNVLRHAESGLVNIEVGTVAGPRGSGREWRLQVVNDSPSGPAITVERGDRGGAGLAGLADRAGRLGGRVETERRVDGESPRFVLAVSVPAVAAAEGGGREGW